MLFFKSTTSNNTSKDANNFAPSCSFADKHSNIVVLAGIAVAVSVFLYIIIGIISIIPIYILPIIICKNLKRKKHFASYVM
ncbi:MAG: hypothetical protein IJE46_00710 [Clostridia bacterium]|nr:hypothetical protein [Clostridia bacterium]